MSKKSTVVAKLVTPAGTAKFAWLAKPDTSEFGKNNYKCGLLLPKGDAKAEAFVKRLRDEHKRAGGKASADPVKDGDAMAEDNEKNESMRGHWFVSAKSKNKPGMVGPKGKGDKITEAPRSGDLVKLSVAIAAYNAGGKKGATLYLNGVQLLERRAFDGTDLFEDESDEYGDGEGGREDSADDDDGSDEADDDGESGDGDF